MPKTLPRPLLVLVCLLLFFIHFAGTAQEAGSRSSLIAFIQKLERDFEIKFSYVDEDISGLEIVVPEAGKLSDLLSYIEAQTQIRIEQLSDRYYALAKSSTVAICARVLDNFEENTVPGATVEVLESDIAVVTDEEGGFSLQHIPRKAILQIKYLGYKTLFVEAEDLLDKSPCKNLLLVPFYNELEEVVVYKFLTTGLIKQTDASISLNTAEFGILPGSIEPDVLQTVQALPGVKSIDETVSDINIRGGSNDQNLLLWDGIKMYQSGHFFGLISAFNPYLTEEVTLIKNGSSAAYGDGVSGIIDMRTKDNLQESFFGGAGFNLISGDLYGQVPIGDKMALQLSARRSLTDFFDTPTYSQFSSRAFQDSQVLQQRANFYFYDFTGKWLYDISSKHRVRLSFININNQLDYDRLETDTGESTESELDQTNLSFGGSLSSEWTGTFSTDISAYHTRYELGAQSIFPDPQQQLLQINEVEETGARLHTHLKLQRGLDWLNGYQFTETGITNQALVTQPPFNSDVKRIMRAHALFSEIAYKSENRKLYAKAGMRLNYYQNPETFEDFIVEPRVNINYSIARSWKLIALGEFKSQVTNQIVDLEQNFLGIEKRRWIISDGIELPVTTSKQGSFGINYDAQNLYIGLEGFFKEVKGISTATQGFQNQNQFNGAIGQYDVKGVEFLINKKTTDYSIWGSYTYNFNQYVFPTEIPPEFPHNLDVRHVVTLAGTYTIDNFKLALGLNYRTGKPFTEPVADNPIDTTFFPSRINFEAANGSRLPEYVRADFSAIYDFALGSDIDATVGASVLNFTDRENVFNIFYRLTSEDTIEKIENKSLGITPNLSFRVRF